MKRIYYIFFFITVCSPSERKFICDNESYETIKTPPLDLNKIFSASDKTLEEQEEPYNNQLRTKETNFNNNSSKKEEVETPSEDFPTLQRLMKEQKDDSRQLTEKFDAIYQKLKGEISVFMQHYTSCKESIYRERMSERAERESGSEHIDKIEEKKTSRTPEFLSALFKKKSPKLDLKKTIPHKAPSSIEYSIPVSLMTATLKKMDDKDSGLRAGHSQVKALFCLALAILEQIAQQKKEQERFINKLGRYIKDEREDDNKEDCAVPTAKINDCLKKMHEYITRYEEYGQLADELRRLQDGSPFRTVSYSLVTTIPLAPTTNYKNNEEDVKKVNYTLLEPRFFLSRLCFCLYADPNPMQTWILDEVNRYFSVWPSDENTAFNKKNISTALIEYLKKNNDPKEHTIPFVDIFKAVEEAISQPISVKNTIKFQWYLEVFLQILVKYYYHLYTLDQHNSKILNDLCFDKTIIKILREKMIVYKNYYEDLKEIQSKVDSDLQLMPFKYTNSGVFLMLYQGQKDEGYVLPLFVSICLATNNNAALSRYYQILKEDIQKTTPLVDPRYYHKLLATCLTYNEIVSVLDILHIYKKMINTFYSKLPKSLQAALEALDQDNKFFWPNKTEKYKNDIISLNKECDRLKLLKDGADSKIIEDHNIKPVFYPYIVPYIKSNVKEFYWYIYYIMSVILDKLSIQISPFVVKVCFDCCSIFTNEAYNSNNIIKSLFDTLTYYEENPLEVLGIFSQILSVYYNNKNDFQYEFLLCLYHLNIMEKTSGNTMPILPNYMQLVADKHKTSYDDVLPIVKQLGENPQDIENIVNLRMALALKQIIKRYPAIMEEEDNIMEKEDNIMEKDKLDRVTVGCEIIEDYITLLMECFDKIIDNKIENKHPEIFKKLTQNEKLSSLYDSMQKTLTLLHDPNRTLINKILPKLSHYLSINKEDKRFKLTKELEQLFLAEVLGDNRVKILKTLRNFYTNEKDHHQKILDKNNNTYTHISYRTYLAALVQYCEKCENYERQERQRRAEAALQKQKKIENEVKKFNKKYPLLNFSQEEGGEISSIAPHNNEENEEIELQSILEGQSSILEGNNKPKQEQPIEQKRSHTWKTPPRKQSIQSRSENQNPRPFNPNTAVQFSLNTSNISGESQDASH